MSPALLFLSGFVAGSVLTYGLQSDHRERCRRILHRAAEARQWARYERHRAMMYLDWAATENEAAKRARDDACQMLGRVERLERRAIAVSVN